MAPLNNNNNTVDYNLSSSELRRFRMEKIRNISYVVFDDYHRFMGDFIPFRCVAGRFYTVFRIIFFTRTYRKYRNSIYVHKRVHVVLFYTDQSAVSQKKKFFF